MTKMTLERAEDIISKMRSTHYMCGDVSISDVEIARKHHRSLTGAALTMAFFTISLVRNFYKWHDMNWLLLACALGSLTFAIHAFIKAYRFDQIRELFENAGPQNLAHLAAGSQNKSEPYASLTQS